MDAWNPNPKSYLLPVKAWPFFHYFMNQFVMLSAQRHKVLNLCVEPVLRIPYVMCVVR